MEMRSDFVKVKLSAHGEQLAAGEEVLVVQGAREYRFKPGEVRDDITRAFDWEKVLKHEFIDGEALFEVVDDAAGEGN
jgi:hypothetical protein